eukprot:CAMPEP_0197905820 /NCGR_PEP_ID=MMETSP1439-20131203/61227_1 /TAXON_ID=66791 /ORGANISM="Gonyaulax spinifera, Strain CCMP409" /LENGTH=130 /DNA_ID=CAMNT_0043527125 /DNA_START=53 /DNA_END=442 /DNA_ORIENTATION=+
MTAVEPQATVVRELDGIPFIVLVLRLEGSEADVLYLDDGSVEREVPLDELIAATSEQLEPWDSIDCEERWQEGIASLMALEQASPTSSIITAAQWEQGRILKEDVWVASACLSAPAQGNGDRPACGGGLR